MRLRLDVAIIGALTVVSIAPAAKAGWSDAVGRCVGVGWGDGYHARNACPPRGSACRHAQMPTPWWATPATKVEPLPHPAARPEGTGETPVPPQRPTGIRETSAPFYLRTTPTTGPSLFRQPGEGSSIHVMNNPTP